MKKFFSVLGILSSITSIILSFITFGLYTGGFELSNTYGGDAYTGIQNAGAQTANNVHYVAEILTFSLGSILLVIGLMGFMYFAIKLCELPAKKPAVTANTVNDVAPVVPVAPQPVITPAEKAPTANEWKCSKCGAINQNYVGTCGCGQLKSEN